MNLLRHLLLTGLLLAATACTSVSPVLKAEAARVIAAEQPTEVECVREDKCAHPSPLLAQVQSDTPQQHRALMLDEGQDALLVRIHMIRAARQQIDLQTFIFDEDDSARLILRELVGAARRGVRVRILIDQLMAMKSTRTLAALAGVHGHLQLKLYNPVFGRGYMSWSDYASGTLCCFRRLNQRMHNKLLLIDGKLGLTGGRNYQDDYFDWDSGYNYRDRDLLLSGPAVAQMQENFEAFWAAERSVPVAELRDVAKLLRREGVPELPRHAYQHPERARLMQAAANDLDVLQQRLIAPSQIVEEAQFVADLPEKHQRDAHSRFADVAPATGALHQLMASTQQELLMQTPYLVFSAPAQKLFTRLRQREARPRVIVSTNSLAATDAFMVYALSHKYKRRYLRRFGFEIYEYKPFPEDAPIDLDATGVFPESPWLPPFGLQTHFSPATAEQVPVDARPPSAHEIRQARQHFWRGSSGAMATLKHAGLRVGLHAKSLVVDGQTAVIGTHNFDPRGDHYNTESAVIIRDAAFAQRLAQSIHRDVSPANSWTIAPHEKFPILPGVGYSLLKVSEHLPVFDLMPRRYAVSWEFQPSAECPTTLHPYHPDFRRCYRSVGSFPEVRIGPKWLATRLLTAFGAGLAPIL
ncbi:phospholipase D family protein [Lysobacteraceae bacterium NML07-0707]|nr:phospholipase D family protein [Xanthomonadaceae bacterium NML07-0707]